MIDTVQIRHRIEMPSEQDLIRMGFKRLQRPSGFESWALASKTLGRKSPRLTWSKTKIGDWLTAETSLPKFLVGRNTYRLDADEVEVAVVELGAFVESTIEAEFDPFTALVGRIDYCENFLVGPDHVPAYLETLSRLTLSRYECQVRGTSVMFRNKSKQIVIYDKYAEVCARRQSVESQDEATGMLRLEVRFRKNACNRLSGRHGQKSKELAGLLKGGVALQELKTAIREIGLNEAVSSREGRIDRLRDYYGDSADVRRVASFLLFHDRFGADFWQGGYGGYSRTMYYGQLRMLKMAGALLYSDAELPALTLVDSDFRGSWE